DLAAPVMACQHQQGRTGDSLHRACEIFIRVDLAPMRKIAGDDHEFHIGVIAVGGFDRREEPGARIEREQFLTARNKMRVRENDEFHGAAPPWTLHGPVCSRPRFGAADRRRDAHFRGSSAVTSVAMSASTRSGSPALFASMIVCNRSLITSVILRPLSPGNAYQLAM